MILNKVGQLTCRDQRWLLAQLSPQQINFLAKVQTSEIKEDNLPEFCTTLAQKNALFIAIILEQGNFHWEDKFLQQFHLVNTMSTLRAHQLGLIKETVKQAVFSSWTKYSKLNSNGEGHG